MGTTQSSRRVVDSSRALNHLRSLERKLKVGAILLIVFGAVFSLVAPAIVAGPFWLRQGRFFRGMSYTSVFLITCLWLIPLMYLLAWLIRGNMSNRFAEETDFGGSVLARRATGRVAAGLVIVDILLFAPRMVMHGARQLIQRRVIGTVDLARAAQILAALARTETSVEPFSLLAEGEEPDTLGSLFAFLMFHEQIDISAKGDRIWLLSSVRPLIK